MKEEGVFKKAEHATALIYDTWAVDTYDSIICVLFIRVFCILLSVNIFLDNYQRTCRRLNE
jgi:hypothetical protein